MDSTQLLQLPCPLGGRFQMFILCFAPDPCNLIKLCMHSFEICFLAADCKDAWPVSNLIRRVSDCVLLGLGSTRAGGEGRYGRCGAAPGAELLDCSLLGMLCRMQHIKLAKTSDEGFTSYTWASEHTWHILAPVLHLPAKEPASECCRPRPGRAQERVRVEGPAALQPTCVLSLPPSPSFAFASFQSTPV